MTFRSVMSALVLFGLVACQPDTEKGPEESAAPKPATRPVIYTVNFPLAWMAETIAGDLVEIVFPAPAEVDPAHWQPEPAVILDYQSADLVLLNGAGYAAWIQYASLSPGQLVDTTASLGHELVPSGDSTHTHGPGGAHDHGDVASHTWLNPRLAASQAEAVAAALSRLLPGQEDRLEQGLMDAKQTLNDLDGAFAEAFAGLRDAFFMYSHPVDQYLDVRYELNGTSLVWEPDQMPDEAQWQRLQELLANNEPAVILWESAPRPAVAERLDVLGVQLVVFRPAGNQAGTLTYWDTMRRNWLALVQAVDASAGNGN